MKVRAREGRNLSEDWALRLMARRTGDSACPLLGIVLLVSSNSGIFHVDNSCNEPCFDPARLREKMLAEDLRSGTRLWGRLMALAVRSPKAVRSLGAMRSAVGVRYSEEVVCERASV